MDYLKFNCYDLAAQNTELQTAYGRIKKLSDELIHIFDLLEPQLKSYEDIQNQISASNNTVADISARFLASYNALDSIIDLYYAAENKVQQTAEVLPIKVISNERRTQVIGRPSIAVSSISSEGLILEDWLMELLYSNIKDENKG